MSWTRTIPEAAPAALAVYSRIRTASTRGAVANLWQTLAVDPKGLTAAHELYLALMGDPAPLAPHQAELIAVVVSATNGCGYCVAHHGPKLGRALEDPELARAVAMDYREANLKAQDRVLLDFAVALTCEPAERTRDDVERLREYGFGDEAIVRAAEIASYYNFTNRLVSTLGVELESELEPWPFGSQK